MDNAVKNPPPYAVASVDHALRLATMLQLEGSLTVSVAAQRLGVAVSTAHRLLAMLVYRDFAVRDHHVYHAGPALDSAVHPKFETARLRNAALPHLRGLTAQLGESTNLSIPAGTTTRFIASVECDRPIRVTSREGMAFPVHRTTTGLLYLSEIAASAMTDLFATASPFDRPDLARLRLELVKVRTNGFALNEGRSERGLVALGVPVRGSDGAVRAGLSVSLPSVRFDRARLAHMVATLGAAARALEIDLATSVGDVRAVSR